MFGFQGGESAATVERKRGYMKDAQMLWPFMTNFDASTIKREEQLVALVRDRSARPRDEVKAEVRSWADGKDFGHGREPVESA